MNVKDVLLKNNFKFNKRFGQNFITDSDLLKKIVDNAGVDKNSTVLEIGVGAGTLTGEIAKQVKKVYGYEIDKNLQPVLSETLSAYNNIDIIYKDIMREPIEDLENKIDGNYTVIANLPYYITTPIIMLFVEKAKNADAVVVMIQREVADRLCAKENTEAYGSITAAIDAVADCETLFYVNRNKFYPVPNVDSAVVKITFNRNKYDIKNALHYRNLVRCAFAMRRKTLVNNLMESYKIDRISAENALQECGIDIKARGETLSTAKFVELCNVLEKS